MLKALNAPLGPVPLIVAVFAVMAAIAVYCLSYAALAGRTETVPEAFAWALVNVLPWFGAFEMAKRFASLSGKAAILLAALLVSLALQWLLLDRAEGLGFELVRRVPGLLITAALVAAGAWPRRDSQAPVADPGELPLAPAQLDWIAAAGNYVELHGCGRTLVHRASLGAVEHQLRGHGFIRIHRSTLVRKARIARVRPADVILDDGTNLRTGKRYRARLNGG